MNKKRLFIFLSFIIFIILLLIFYQRPFFIFLAWFITIFYIVWGIIHIIKIIFGVRKPFNPKLDLKYYPTISVIVPSRNEQILSRTIDVIINHVNYPLDKKEIIVVTEDELSERIAFWYQQKYPDVVLLRRKRYFPTKPSALNDAFQIARGEIIGVVDVEDILDRDIFIKVASAITQHGYDYVQTVLRISNVEDSWITKIFAMEYAGWFRIFLNGRSHLNLFTPLGGTGNYFRKSLLKEVGGWDSINLTEDAELTVRFNIAKAKFTVIDARQWEEAPVNFKAWLRQRTRWFRGWMQTLWKYIPIFLKPYAVKRIGFKNLISIIFMLIAPFAVILNWVAYALTALWILEYYSLIPTKLLADTFPFFAIAPLIFNVIYYLAWIKGAMLERIGKKHYKYIPLMAIYMNVLMPLAALRALYQEITKPVFWEKTEHPGRGVRGFIKENFNNNNN
jgi:cellulose synthase/poly-beta-1,6-N-acetylglucosamine synthase-like glycosyltransferase